MLHPSRAVLSVARSAERCVWKTHTDIALEMGERAASCCGPYSDASWNDLHPPFPKARTPPLATPLPPEHTLGRTMSSRHSVRCFVSLAKSRPRKSTNELMAIYSGPGADFKIEDGTKGTQVTPLPLRKCGNYHVNQEPAGIKIGRGTKGNRKSNRRKKSNDKSTPRSHEDERKTNNTLGNLGRNQKSKAERMCTARQTLVEYIHKRRHLRHDSVLAAIYTRGGAVIVDKHGYLQSRLVWLGVVHSSRAVISQMTAAIDTLQKDSCHLELSSDYQAEARRILVARLQQHRLQWGETTDALSTLGHEFRTLRSSRSRVQEWDMGTRVCLAQHTTRIAAVRAVDSNWEEIVKDMKAVVILTSTGTDSTEKAAFLKKIDASIHQMSHLLAGCSQALLGTLSSCRRDRLLDLGNLALPGLEVIMYPFHSVLVNVTARYNTHIREHDLFQKRLGEKWVSKPHKVGVQAEKLYKYTAMLITYMFADLQVHMYKRALELHRTRELEPYELHIRRRKIERWKTTAAFNLPRNNQFLGVYGYQPSPWMCNIYLSWLEGPQTGLYHKHTILQDMILNGGWNHEARTKVATQELIATRKFSMVRRQAPRSPSHNSGEVHPQEPLEQRQGQLPGGLFRFIPVTFLNRNTSQVAVMGEYESTESERHVQMSKPESIEAMWLASLSRKKLADETTQIKWGTRIRRVANHRRGEEHGIALNRELVNRSRTFWRLSRAHFTTSRQIWSQNSAITVETRNSTLDEGMQGGVAYGNDCEWETFTVVDTSETQERSGADGTSNHQQHDPLDTNLGAMSQSATNGGQGRDDGPPQEQNTKPPRDENHDSETDTESESSEPETEDAEEAEEAEKHIPLSFQIPEETLRNAMQASPNTKASFWSHTMYRDPKTADPDFKRIKVHYCKTKEVGETVAKYFLNEKVIGFDIEWKYDFRPADIKENASLIQIACENRIALFHISLYKGKTADELLPPTLKTILESPDIAKVGVAIRGDFTRCWTYLGIKACHQIELSRLHNLVEYRDMAPKMVNNKLVGMAKQVQTHLQLPLAKGDVRKSDWSKPLTTEQVEYAASDAYAGFRIYDVLEMKRKAMKPVPTPPAPFDWDGEEKPKKVVPKKKKTEEKAVAAEVAEEDEGDVYETALEDSLDSQELDAESEFDSSESSESDGDLEADYVPPARRFGKLAVGTQEEGVSKVLQRPQRVGRVSLAALKGDAAYPSPSSYSSEEQMAGAVPALNPTDMPNSKLDVNMTTSPISEGLDSADEPVFASFKGRMTWPDDPKARENEPMEIGMGMEVDDPIDEESATLLQAMTLESKKPRRKAKATSKIDQRDDVQSSSDTPGPVLEQNEDGDWVTKDALTETEGVAKPIKERKERKKREPKLVELAPAQPPEQEVGQPSLDTDNPPSTSTTTLTPAPEHSPEHILASTWARSYLTSTIPPASPNIPHVPRIHATISHLRAYHLWHHQHLSISQIARILRPEPQDPLKESTVASYVLQAVMLERLEYRPEELRQVLRDVPRAVREGRFRGLWMGVGGF